jgi:hypothetical protein
VAAEAPPAGRSEELNADERSDTQVRFRILQDTPRFVLAAE